MHRFLLYLLPLFFTLNVYSNESVSIQLKWKHSFQFAGYYAAVEKGFYKEEGLNVTLKEIDLNKNFIKSVVAGESEYGVSDSSLVIHHSKNIPVVLVSQIFQHSPLVFISHRDSKITTPYDLVGKKVSFSVNGTGGTPFRALMLKTIGNLNDINISEFTSYKDFIDKKVDVTSAYSTSQPYWLKKQGIYVNVIDPKSYGIDFYGDNFFTSQKELKEYPSRVEKMKKATLKGWEYALLHQDEIIDIILKKYAPEKKRDELAFEARGTYQMIMPDLTQLGSFRKEKYEQVAKTYHQLGIIESKKINDDFFYKSSDLLTNEEKKWLEDNPMIKMAVMDYWAVDSNRNNIHTDLIKLLNKYGDLNIVPVKFDAWRDGFEEASSGEYIHAITNISRSKQREKKFLFTKAYNFTPNHLIVRNDNNDIKSLEDLTNCTIYLKEKIIAHDLIKEISKSIKVINVKTDDEIYKKLSTNSNSNVVATVSYSVDREKLKKYNLKIVKTTYGKYGKIHIGVSHKYPLLKSIINKIYEIIPKNELTNLQNKIYKKRKTTINLTKKEEKWLEKNKNITFAGDPNWLPFEAFDKSGKYIGIVSDYLKELEKLLPIKFQPKQTEYWIETLDLAKNKMVDVVSDSIDSDSMENYTPIDSFISAPIVIVMRSSHTFVNDLGDISDKKIALIEGYGYNANIKKKYPTQKFIYVENADIVLEQLSTGKIDAAVLSMPKAGYLIRSKGYNNLKIVGKTSVNLNLSLFVLNSKPELRTALQKAMSSLSTMQHSDIIKGWQKVEFAKKTDYTLLYQIVGLFGLFLFGTFYWNRKLSHEIQERKKIENALQEAKIQADQANQSKSEFLANMSHEIRTPMNSVIGFSELLSKLITDPIQKDYLDSIMRGGNSLLGIINDILDLSKIEAGKLDIVLESVNIKQLANEMESIFQVKLIQKNLHFILDIDPSLPKYLLLDSARIRQILFNLLGNAIKFTSSGNIKLSVKQDKLDIEKSKIDLLICVTDSGIGIKKEYQEEIFHTFEQQRGQDSLKYGGTGLGLSICKKLVQIMNGSISVESEVGKGSKFSVILKDVAISSVGLEAKEIKQEYAHIKFKKATVMVVDDIKDNRKLVSTILKEHNLDIIEAIDGKDAIEKLHNVKVNLIFMDIKMPVMDGYEATKIIKNDKVLKNIPIVALTASVLGKDMQKIKEYNFDGYLRKPVTYDKLLSEMGRFLKYKKLDIEPSSELSSNNLENIPKVIKILENELQDRWKDIKDKGDFSLIEDFSISLELLGDENGISVLKNYAKELKSSCESFDIEKIDFMMNSYFSLIEKLRELKS